MIKSKAIALYSGGLDSILALYLMKSQGIDVIPLHFTSPFSPLNPDDPELPIRKHVENFGLELRFLDKGDEFLEIVKNPIHGHGKNMNPCIDCRIHTLIKAKEFMLEQQASFLVTGEVVGQRPMSQLRNTIRMIEKQAGCDGLIVRPLSGKILPPSNPEIQGMIDRDKLYAIAGRGRKMQIKLARDAGINNYSAPAGGCLLTDKIFARKVRDLYDHQETVTREDIQLLHIGRHIRLRNDIKIIVGRSETENEKLFAKSGDKIFFEPEDFPGPAILAPKEISRDDYKTICSILLRYTKPALRGNKILVHMELGVSQFLISDVADDSWLAGLIIQ